MNPSDETLLRTACQKAFRVSDTVYAVSSVPVEGVAPLAFETFSVVQFASGQCAIIVPADWENDPELRAEVDAILQQEGARASGQAPN